MKHFQLDLDVCVTQPQWGINLEKLVMQHMLDVVSGKISNLCPE